MDCNKVEQDSSGNSKSESLVRTFTCDFMDPYLGTENETEKYSPNVSDIVEKGNEILFDLDADADFLSQLERRSPCDFSQDFCSQFDYFPLNFCDRYKSSIIILLTCENIYFRKELILRFRSEIPTKH
jgi:hypothetical protein